MKLKKLLAAVVAGVMALTMAPIAASAADGYDVSLGSPFNGFRFGIAGTQMVVDKADILGTGANEQDYTATLEIPFDKIFSQQPITYTIPSDVNVKIATVVSDISGLGATNDLSKSQYGSGVTQVTVDTDARYTTSSLGTYVFELTSDKKWKVKDTDGTEQEVDTINLTVTVAIGAALQYNVSLSNATSARGGLLEIKDLSTNQKTFGDPITGGRAHEGDIIKLTDPNPNIANDGEKFASWKFSTPVEISDAGGYFANSSLDTVLKTDGTKKYTQVYFDPTVGTEIEIIMPKSLLTITAYDTDGAAYGSSTPGSSTTPTTPNSGQYLLTLYGADTASRYVVPGTIVTVYPYTTTDFEYWTVSGVSGDYTIRRSAYQFEMPANSVTITANNYAEDSITVATNGYGSAKADKSTAIKGQTVTFTATASGTVAASYDPYLYMNYGYYPTTTTYNFSRWTFDKTVTYADGYSATSNPTKVIMPSGDLKATANYTLSNNTPYYPNNTNTNTNSTSFTSGGVTASYSPTTGVIEAGLNSTGSVNSTATTNAIKAAVARNVTGSTVTLNVSSNSTGISKSTMQKFLSAVGSSRNFRVQISGTFGSIIVPVSSARQINTRVSMSGNAITSAVNTFKKAFGNTDIKGIQTSQASTFGASAQYRISADAIGLNADYGDTVYVAIYNPSTRRYTKKTVVVNANGQIAFASSSSGIILFSTKPYSAK
jgi:hypothetical protein